MSEEKNPIAKFFNFFVGCAQIVSMVVGIIALIISFIAFVWAVKNPNAVPQIIKVVSGEPTITPPIIILQTSTSLPVYTQTPEPTSTASLPSFYDDFENGIKSDWTIVYGNLGMANGKFTVTTPFNGSAGVHLAILGNYNWKNVQIKAILVKLYERMSCFPCSYNAATAIIVRYNPSGTSIGLLIMPGLNQIAFATLDSKGDWSIIDTTKVGAPFDNTNEITVKTNGQNYFALINGKQLTSATIPGVTSGQVGLWFLNSASESSIDSYAPRFDSFAVQEIQ